MSHWLLCNYLYAQSHACLKCISRSGLVLNKSSSCSTVNPGLSNPRSSGSRFPSLWSLQRRMEVQTMLLREKKGFVWTSRNSVYGLSCNQVKERKKNESYGHIFHFTGLNVQYLVESSARKWGPWGWELSTQTLDSIEQRLSAQWRLKPNTPTGHRVFPKPERMHEQAWFSTALCISTQPIHSTVCADKVLQRSGSPRKNKGDLKCSNLINLFLLPKDVQSPGQILSWQVK